MGTEERVNHIKALSNGPVARFFIGLLFASSLQGAGEARAQESKLGITTPVTQCDAFYPAAEKTAHTNGQVLLSLSFTKDGKAHDSIVAKSSGNQALDAAALSCANGFSIAPPTLDGQPLEISWLAIVLWRADGHSFITIPSLKPPCVNYPDPGREAKVTMVKFRIHDNGTVSDSALVKTSGDDDLDKEALFCVNYWIYPVPQINGEPTELDWQAALIWAPRE